MVEVIIIIVVFLVGTYGAAILNNKRKKEIIYPLDEIIYENDTIAAEMYAILLKMVDRDDHFLVVDVNTTKEAINRCYEMIAEDEVSHSGFANTASTLFKLGADIAGENVAYGYRTAKGVMKAFWESESHRKNMLNENYDWVGIGAVKDKKNKYYFCMIFGGDNKIK